jgi:hypothetical protein
VFFVIYSVVLCEGFLARRARGDTCPLVVSHRTAEGACGVPHLHLLFRLLLGLGDPLDRDFNLALSVFLLPKRLLRRAVRFVEALGLLEDVLASGESLKDLGDLLGRVEALGLLEDVLASSESLKGLGDLLGDGHRVAARADTSHIGCWFVVLVCWFVSLLVCCNEKQLLSGIKFICQKKNYH